MADYHDDLEPNYNDDEWDPEQEPAGYRRYRDSFYPYPFYYGQCDYDERRMQPPFSPSFQAGASPRPVCEAANTVYAPARFYSEPSTNRTSYEIEVRP